MKFSCGESHGGTLGHRNSWSLAELTLALPLPVIRGKVGVHTGLCQVTRSLLCPVVLG